MQATKWTAQLTNGVKMAGGQSHSFTSHVNVSEVPMDLLKIFTIAHNTYAHLYHVPTSQWYKDGVRWNDYIYPTLYELPDGTTLTVDTDGVNLVLTQV